MASQVNKMTIHITPGRTTQRVTVKLTGRFGRRVLSHSTLKAPANTLSPATTLGAYWRDVDVQVATLLASLP